MRLTKALKKRGATKCEKCGGDALAWNRCEHCGEVICDDCYESSFYYVRTGYELLCKECYGKMAKRHSRDVLDRTGIVRDDRRAIIANPTKGGRSRRYAYAA